VPSFGDKVRIRRSDETVEHGSADQLGAVLGESIPSGTGLDYGPVVGGTAEDFILFVKLDSGGEGWFAASLVEFVDHQAGLVMALDGGPTFHRLPDGTWQEQGGRTSVGDVLNPTESLPRRLPRGGLRALFRWLGQRGGDNKSDG